MGEDVGKLILRLAVGGLLLFHGVHKLLNGIAAIKSMIAAHALPDTLAYGVYAGEIVGPVLVIVGLAARLGGVLIAANMIVALWLAGVGHYLALNDQGGYALELEALYLLGGITIAWVGAGRLSIGGESGQLN